MHTDCTNARENGTNCKVYVCVTPDGKAPVSYTHLDVYKRQLSVLSPSNINPLTAYTYDAKIYRNSISRVDKLYKKELAASLREIHLRRWVKMRIASSCEMDKSSKMAPCSFAYAISSNDNSFR